MIKLRSVSKEYVSGQRTFTALKEIDVSIEKGELIFITGPSGSGKSTLLHIIGLLTSYTKGNYVYKGRQVDELSDNAKANIRLREIGFVFQSYHLLNYLTALENVSLPLGYSGYSKKEASAMSENMLDKVGLKTKMDNEPGEMSGGEQQRVAIARALVINPEIILADEPTGNLDSQATNEIMDVFKSLHQEGRTIVIVTHNMEIVQRGARVISLKDGQIISDGAEIAKTPYGKGV